MRVTRTVGVAALVLAALAGGAVGKARHKRGRVVRVERAPPGRTEVPRLCGPMQTDGSATCYGKAVDVDEQGTVYDENGRRAVVRVNAVTPQPDSCGDIVSWNIQSQAVQGTLDQVTYSAYAMFDWSEGGERGRAIINNGQIPVPGQLPNESVMAAFDTDGDDTAEMIVTSYSCDLSGAPVVSGTPGAYCIVYYERTGGSYKALRTDVVKNC